MTLALRCFARLVCVCGSGIAVVALFVTGCGQQEPKRITAASSGLQADEATDESAAASAAASKSPLAAPPVEKGAPATRGGAATKIAAAHDAAPAAVAGGTPAAEKPRAAAGTPAVQPKPVAADSLNPYPVPDGTPAELMQFVADLDARLANRQIPGGTRQEMLANVKLLFRAQFDAAEKAYTKFPEAKDRSEAAKKAFESLQMLDQLGATDSPQLLKALCEKLKADPDPGLAQQGHTIGFRIMAEDIETGKLDRELFFKELSAVLATEAQGPQLFMVLTGVASRLQAANMTADAAKAFRMIGQSLSKSKNRQAVEQAGELLVLADVIEADLEGLLSNLIDGKPEAAKTLLAAVDTLLAKTTPGQLLLTRLTSLGQTLEFRDQNETAGKVYAALAATYSKSADASLVATAAKLLPNFEKRSAIVGQPLALAGTLANGEAFDPKKKATGKVVLLCFWTISSLRQSQAELGELFYTAQQFADRGFTVLGVCVDDDPKAAQQFIAGAELPWEVIYGAPGKGYDQPLAQAAGIDVTPSYVLLGADGKVLATQARGEKLEKKLTELLGPPAVVAEAPAGLPPGGRPAPAPKGAPPARPAVEAPPEAAPPPATGAPPQVRQNMDTLNTLVGMPSQTPFVAAAEEPKDKPAAVPAEVKPAEAKPAKPEAAAAPEKKAAEEVNPYSADPDLSPTQLADFILEMRDKPAPIQERPGFLEAVLEASDRLLANPKSSERFQLIAVAAQFELLHARACLGDEKCQEKLMALVDKMANDKRAPVVKEVKLLRLEQKVLAADKLPLEQIPALVKEVQDYCAQEPLTERHLRLASSTVKAVNRLANADERDKYFTALGGLYAKSEFKRLARYGKKLAAGEAKSASDFIGRPMELAGATAKGDVLDWKSYRGKVVIVDFWATWCGPCRAEMPHVKELFEKREAEGFAVLGVSLDKDEEALAKYLEENTIPWSTLAGEGTADLAEKYGVEGIPTMFLVDQEGKVVAVAHNVAELEPKAAALLKKAK